VPLIIRKSFAFGPLRVNVSRGGLGVSIGFSWLRVGVNGRGPYVQVGKSGVWYRRYLTGRREDLDGADA
jgi:hypothetical protein